MNPMPVGAPLGLHSNRGMVSHHAYSNVPNSGLSTLQPLHRIFVIMRMGSQLEVQETADVEWNSWDFGYNVASGKGITEGGTDEAGGCSQRPSHDRH